jgi:demethylmenaquinone methyltransferase/2-methoxy-6-polyprenyl-1,4-benzoquinol methylase
MLIVRPVAAISLFRLLIYRVSHATCPYDSHEPLTLIHAVAVDKSNDRVRQMFAQIAGKYDRMNHLLSLNFDRYWRWRTVRTVRPQGDAPILDVCTGTGDLAFAFARVCPDSTAIVAADFCPEMLEVGQAKSRRVGTTEQIEFVTADTQQLPFEDNCYQIVSVAFGLRNVADTDRGLGEMFRVCQPGGQVAILEFSMPRRQPLKGLYGWYFRRILPRLGERLARNQSGAYNYLPESVGEFPSGDRLIERMEAAGLKQVSQHPFTLGVATLYVGRK